METVIRMEGRAKLEWLKKKKLATDSLTDEWIGALIQDKKIQMTQNMLLPYLTGVSTLTKKLYCVMLVKREVSTLNTLTFPQVKSRAFWDCTFSMVLILHLR